MPARAGRAYPGALSLIGVRVMSSTARKLATPALPIERLAIGLGILAAVLATQLLAWLIL